MSSKQFRAYIPPRSKDHIFQETNQGKIKRPNRCLVCNATVDSKSQSSDEEVKDDDFSFYTNYKNKRHFKNYISLFCKIINLSFEDSFSELFTSNSTYDGNQKGKYSTNQPDCCSRCYDLLINIWKLQDIIKQTQDLQQKDVNILKKLLLKGPSNRHLIPGLSVGTGTSAESLKVSTSPSTSASATSTLKKCSVILTKCEDVFPSTSKAETLSPKSFTNKSPKRARKSALNCMKLIKTLTSPEKTIESKSDEIELELPCDEDYFHPEDFSSGEEFEYLHDPLESADESVCVPGDDDDDLYENVDDPVFETEKTQTRETNQDSQQSRRDANFSYVEIDLLSKLAYKNRHILYPKLHSSKKVNPKHKRAVFQKITTAINLASGRSRSVDQIQKKFYNMHPKLLCAEKNGSPPGENESDDENIIDDIFPDINSLEDSKDISSHEPGEVSDISHPEFHPASKIKRSTNFSRKELKLLTKLVGENMTVLNSKIDPTKILRNAHKARIWKEITGQLNKQCGNNRTINQIRKKVCNERIMEQQLKTLTQIGENSTHKKESEDASYSENDSTDNPESKTNILISSPTKTATVIKQTYGKQTRDNNFSYEETQLVIKLYQENKKHLFTRTNLCSSILPRQKRKIWTKITTAVNKFTGNNRSVVQIQKKIYNLRTTLKNNPGLSLSSIGWDEFSDFSLDDNDTKVFPIKNSSPSLITAKEPLSDMSTKRMTRKPRTICDASSDENDEEPSKNESKQSTEISGKKRDANFSPLEIKLLLKFVINKRNVLYPDQDSASDIMVMAPNQAKQKIWTNIVNSMNKASGKDRTVEQIRKKFYNLISSSKRELSQHGEETPEAPSTDENTGDQSVKLEENDTDCLIENLNETASSDRKISSWNQVCKLAVKYSKRHQLQESRLKRDQLSTQCRQCKQTFSHIYGLRSHMLTHLPKSARKQFICSKCGDQFLSQRAVNFHMVRIHKEEPSGESLVCHICDQKFYPFDGFRFRKHVQSHTGQPRPRPFMCDTCGQGFFDRAGLQKHANVHSTERRHQCEFCSESYKHASNLKRHRVTCHKHLITDPAPKYKPVIPYEYTPDFIGPRIAYPCEFCEKAFALRSRMTKHLLVCKVRKDMECE